MLAPPRLRLYQTVEPSATLYWASSRSSHTSWPSPSVAQCELDASRDCSTPCRGRARECAVREGKGRRGACVRARYVQADLQGSVGRQGGACVRTTCRLICIPASAAPSHTRQLRPFCAWSDEGAFGSPSQRKSTCRDAAEVQMRCSGDAAEMQGRCSGDAAEVRRRCGGSTVEVQRRRGAGCGADLAAGRGPAPVDSDRAALVHK